MNSASVEPVCSLINREVLVPKLCIDLNGVLADTGAGICDVIRREHGIILPSRRFSKALVGGRYPKVSGDGQKKLTRSMYGHAKKILFDTAAFLNVPAVDGAAETLAKLRGWDLIVVSDARSVSRTHVNAWLEKRGFPEMDVVLTRSAKPKFPLQCNCTVVIDNEIAQLVPLLELPEDPTLIHFLPAPGTASCDIAETESFDSRIKSLRGWPEVGSFLDEIEVASRLAA